MIFRITIAIIIAGILTSCSSNKKKTSAKKAALIKTQTAIKRNPHRYPGSYKIGQPYKINHIRYYPKSYIKYVSSGMASWYGAQDGFHGKLTANGDIFDKNMLTAAHKTLPLPSIVKVTNLYNKKTTMLMINDRGPFCGKRLLDVSERAAEVLGFKAAGTARVKVEYLASETSKLLAKLRLQNIHGKVAVQDILNPSCSVDCYLTNLNKKNNINNREHNITSIASLGERSSNKVTVVAIDSLTNLSKASYYIVAGRFKTIAEARDFCTKITKSNVGKYSLTRIRKAGKQYQIKFGPIKELAIAKQTANNINLKSGARAVIIHSNQNI